MCGPTLKWRANKHSVIKIPVYVHERWLGTQRPLFLSHWMWARSCYEVLWKWYIYRYIVTVWWEKHFMTDWHWCWCSCSLSMHGSFLKAFQCMSKLSKLFRVLQGSLRVLKPLKKLLPIPPLRPSPPYYHSFNFILFVQVVQKKERRG
jgi:hypothetical protein